MRSAVPCDRPGFTLIELLVVVAIISVLASLLLPALQKARTHAKMSACVSNMKQIGLGMMQYAGDNREQLPPRYGSASSNFSASDWAMNNAKAYQYGLPMALGLLYVGNYIGGGEPILLALPQRKCHGFKGIEQQQLAPLTLRPPGSLLDDVDDLGGGQLGSHREDLGG